ncbi:hypothetical protein G4O51_04140 [Candidatus Bathyarchaeota archaeon A05DMB-2]|jgi:hypothetical protein|nr:hypothetical protein [Candidatus Bathyarchaeota archaeon A05DMB-2]
MRRLSLATVVDPEGRVIFIVEGESRDTVLEAFLKINVSVASITEAEEVTPKIM